LLSKSHGIGPDRATGQQILNDVGELGHRSLTVEFDRGSAAQEGSTVRTYSTMSARWLADRP
jgi:hypothetical protein